MQACSSVANFISVRVDKAAKLKQTLGPYVLVLGHEAKPTEFYSVFNGDFVKQRSLRGALEFIMGLFWAFDLEYPDAAQSFYVCMEHLFYGFKATSSRPMTHASRLIAALTEDGGGSTDDVADIIDAVAGGGGGGGSADAVDNGGGGGGSADVVDNGGGGGGSADAVDNGGGGGWSADALDNSGGGGGPTDPVDAVGSAGGLTLNDFNVPSGVVSCARNGLQAQKRRSFRVPPAKRPYVGRRNGSRQKKSRETAAALQARTGEEQLMVAQLHDDDDDGEGFGEDVEILSVEPSTVDDTVSSETEETAGVDGDIVAPSNDDDSDASEDSNENSLLENPEFSPPVMEQQKSRELREKSEHDFYSKPLGGQELSHVQPSRKAVQGWQRLLPQRGGKQQ